jgi:hypothetical protein
LTKHGAIPKEHPAEFYDGPGDHDHHPSPDAPTSAPTIVTAEIQEVGEGGASGGDMEVVNHTNDDTLAAVTTADSVEREDDGDGSAMNLETVD